MSNNEQIVSGWRLVIKGAIAFFIITLILTLHRHYTFYSSYDHGIFNQVFWNGIHGNFFQSSLSSALSTNVVHSNQVPSVYYHRLGQHFTPALLLWLPLYALFPTPATLIVIQVTLVTAAGVVLYILARQYLAPAIAATITLSFYVANGIVGPTLSNFHDICQTPLYMFTLLLAMEKRWWWLFWGMAILILSVREDSGIGLFGVGFYLLVSRRYPLIGIAVCALSFGYILTATNVLMPLFSQDISKRFMLEQFGQFTESSSASTIDIIWGMVSNPWRLIVEIVSPVSDTLNYLLAQWLPLAFIPAIAPASWAIAGFPLLQLFLGKAQSLLSISVRYAMTVVPGVFYGTILWWSVRPQLFKKYRLRKFWHFCIVLSLILSIVYSPNRTLYFLFPDSYQPLVYVSLPEQWGRLGNLQKQMARIPANASVATSTYLLPHLSGRRAIVKFPQLQFRNDEKQITTVDYIVADLWQLQRYQIIFRRDREELKSMVGAIDRITEQAEYGITEFKDGVISLQKQTPSDSTSVKSWLAFRQEIEPILRK
jgi:uncharacterized membrane protein